MGDRADRVSSSLALRFLVDLSAWSSTTWFSGSCPGLNGLLLSLRIASTEAGKAKPAQMVG